MDVPVVQLERDRREGEQDEPRPAGQPDERPDHRGEVAGEEHLPRQHAEDGEGLAGGRRVAEGVEVRGVAARVAVQVRQVDRPVGVGVEAEHRMGLVDDDDVRQRDQPDDDQRVTDGPHPGRPEAVRDRLQPGGQVEGVDAADATGHEPPPGRHPSAGFVARPIRRWSSGIRNRSHATRAASDGRARIREPRRSAQVIGTIAIS